MKYLFEDHLFCSFNVDVVFKAEYIFWTHFFGNSVILCERMSKNHYLDILARGTRQNVCQTQV